jgi:hypothetical protein
MNILKFKEFLLLEAIKDEHYDNRTLVRIYDDGVYTEPKFNINKFKKQIEDIENTKFPYNQPLINIYIKLDQYYINKYFGGSFSLDSADYCEKGSKGDSLFFIIKYNVIETVMYKDIKILPKDAISYDDLIKVIEKNNFNLSKIKVTKENIKNILKGIDIKDIYSNIKIKFKENYYYYHKLYDKKHDVLINTKDKNDIIYIDNIENINDYNDVTKQILNHENYLKESIAYHGSPYDFYYFSSNMFYEGEGNHGFGCGFYFSENKDDAKDYVSKLEKEKGEGRLYKVNIPSKKYFLNLDIYNNEQNKYIQQCLDKIDFKIKERIVKEYNYIEYKKQENKDYINEYINDEFKTLQTYTFFQILENLYDDEHAEILSNVGIKGNIHTKWRYIHYVVFNEEDIHVLNKTKPRL